MPPIPAGDRALDEIRTGKAAGLSVEFRALKESRVAGVRVIEEAELSGVGIVARPSYEGSRDRSAFAPAWEIPEMALNEAELATITTTVASRITGTILGRERSAGVVEMEIAGAAVSFCYDIAPGTRPRRSCARPRSGWPAGCTAIDRTSSSMNSLTHLEARSSSGSTIFTAATANGFRASGASSLLSRHIVRRAGDYRLMWPFSTPRRNPRSGGRLYQHHLGADRGAGRRHDPTSERDGRD